MNCIHSDPIFFADIIETAAVTVRLCPRCTDFSSMIDKTVAEIIAFFRRYDLPESHFHLFRILHVMDKADAVGKADTVSICYNGRLAEYVPHDQVCAFSAHTGKLQKCVKVFRHLVVILFVENAHTGADVPGFAFPRPQDVQWLRLLPALLLPGLHIRVFCIEILNNYIDPGIGALSCQTDTYKKLPGIIIIQCTVCIRIFLF